MSVVLAAIDAAGVRASVDDQRRAVVDAFFATRDRDSVLGRYSIDDSGDTTLSAFSGYSITRGGSLRYDRTLALP